MQGCRTSVTPRPAESGTGSVRGDETPARPRSGCDRPPRTTRLVARLPQSSGKAALNWMLCASSAAQAPGPYTRNIRRSGAFLGRFAASEAGSWWHSVISLAPHLMKSARPSTRCSPCLPTRQPASQPRVWQPWWPSLTQNPKTNATLGTHYSTWLLDPNQGLYADQLAASFVQLEPEPDDEHKASDALLHLLTGQAAGVLRADHVTGVEAEASVRGLWESRPHPGPARPGTPGRGRSGTAGGRH